MPAIYMLNIITMNFNTTDTQETDKSNKCCTNIAICQDSRHGKHYTNILQEVERAEKCHINTDTISNSKIKISQWLLIMNLAK